LTADNNDPGTEKTNNPDKRLTTMAIGIPLVIHTSGDFMA